MSRLALSQEQDEALLREALDELDPFVSYEFADEWGVCDTCEQFFEIFMVPGRHGNWITADEHVCKVDVRSEDYDTWKGQVFSGERA